MKVIYMGTPKFSAEILKVLIQNNIDVVLVVTQTDKQVGRGKKIQQTDVKKVAIEYGLELFQPENINTCFDYLNSFNADFIVTCAYGQILTNSILQIPNKKAINIHASLLPKHRGGAPIHRCILENDKYSGITIMEMIEKLDAGNIYDQEKVIIDITDTYDILHDKLVTIGSKLILKVLNDFDNISPIVQDESLVTYSPNISKNERIINFNTSSESIYNKVRAFYSSPVAITYYDNLQIKICEVQVTTNMSKFEPGTIIDINRDGILVCSADYDIIIKKLIMPGKKEVNSNEFYNGNKTLKIRSMFRWDV